LSAFFAIAVIIILVLGGLYLAYEGAEKYTILFPHEHAKHEISLEPMTEEQIWHSKKKIKSAIVTDFILSVEIVIIVGLS
jgi:predicted DNA repair protein MutK